LGDLFKEVTKIGIPQVENSRRVSINFLVAVIAMSYCFTPSSVPKKYWGIAMGARVEQNAIVGGAHAKWLKKPRVAKVRNFVIQQAIGAKSRRVQWEDQKVIITRGFSREVGRVCKLCFVKNNLALEGFEKLPLDFAVFLDRFHVMPNYLQSFIP
jgi:hypothetical protein